MGPPDIGKSILGSYLSKRLFCYFTPFPNLALSSISGRALFNALTNYPQDLEDNPYWWSLMYAANLEETQELIQDQLKSAPVVTTGYYYNFLHWSRSARENKGIRTNINHFSSYVQNVIKPDAIYTLNNKVCSSENQHYKFSLRLTSRIERSVEKFKLGTKADEKYITELPYEHINSITERIGKDLHKKFGIRYNESILATREDFIR